MKDKVNININHRCQALAAWTQKERKKLNGKMKDYTRRWGD